MSDNGKKEPLNSVESHLENLENLQNYMADYAKAHPFKVMGASFLAGVAIAQVVRLCAGKGKNNGK